MPYYELVWLRGPYSLPSRYGWPLWVANILWSLYLNDYPCLQHSYSSWLTLHVFFKWFRFMADLKWCINWLWTTELSDFTLHLQRENNWILTICFVIMTWQEHFINLLLGHMFQYTLWLVEDVIKFFWLCLPLKQFDPFLSEKVPFLKLNGRCVW